MDDPLHVKKTWCGVSENGGKGEDRFLVERCEQGILAVIADGAGGIGGGACAAEMTCSLAMRMMRAMDGGTPGLWERCLRDVDQSLTGLDSAGQSTAVIAQISRNNIAGASVGDSGAWMFAGREIIDLTEHQQRKPLLGSGEARPVTFGPIQVSGRMLLATDGLFKYAARRDIAQRAATPLLDEAVAALIAGLRLRSGALQDDVAIILFDHAA